MTNDKIDIVVDTVVGTDTTTDKSASVEYIQHFFCTELYKINPKAEMNREFSQKLKFINPMTTQHNKTTTKFE